MLSEGNPFRSKSRIEAKPACCGRQVHVIKKETGTIVPARSCLYREKSPRRAYPPLPTSGMRIIAEQSEPILGSYL